jgi:hypothetical protein
MAEPADVHIWSDASKEKFPATVTGNPAAILRKLQHFGTKSSTATVNFVNGKIEMHAKNFPDASIRELYKDFKLSPQNGELLRKLPPDNVVGLMSVSLDQQVIKNIMQHSGLRALFNEMQKEIPLKLNPALIATAFKTNMLLALLRDEKLQPDSATKKTLGFEFLLAVPIANKASFEKIKDQFLPLIDSMKRNEPGKMNGMPVAKYNDDLLVVSLKSSTADAFLFNPAPGEAPAWIHEFSQYPMVMNFNFSKLFRILLKTETPKEGMDVLAKTMDQVYFYGGNFNEGAIEMNMEFRFADKEVNALQQLLKMMSSVK